MAPQSGNPRAAQRRLSRTGSYVAQTCSSARAKSREYALAPACHQRQPLDAVKVGVLNGHHPRIRKQLLREVVDELQGRQGAEHTWRKEAAQGAAGKMPAWRGMAEGVHSRHLLAKLLHRMLAADDGAQL